MTTNMTPEQEQDILKLAEECADEMRCHMDDDYVMIFSSKLRAKDAATIAQQKEEIERLKGMGDFLIGIAISHKDERSIHHEWQSAELHNKIIDAIEAYGLEHKYTQGCYVAHSKRK